MDTVSRLFGECYTKQIGDWCRQHGVKYIGHVVEDSGAHARLGYGSGHFFRAIHGQDMSGMDIVYQIWPEITSGRVTTPFGYLDAGFFYWGLAKMASSAGHIDPKKNGMTACEIFGAYGWQEGLKLMKWLTDHACVRGVNWLIPHAFSPRKSDWDCPPHFYARGHNPQWRYFHIWSGYANRVCNLLTGGKHVAAAAVIYHAEAEWAGRYMPFEEAVKALAVRQMDCDVVPVDVFVGKEAVSIREGSLVINNEEYSAVIVPYAERLPEEFVSVLLELAQNGIYVIFINDFPAGSSTSSEKFLETLNALKMNRFSMNCPLDVMPAKLEKLNLRDIEISSFEEYLRYYHYQNEKEQIYFFTNESKHNVVRTTIKFKNMGVPLAYDAMEDKLYRMDFREEGDFVFIDLCLRPYESLFVLFVDGKVAQDKMPAEKLFQNECESEYCINSNWDINTVEMENHTELYRKVDCNFLGNAAVPGILPEFSGTLRYETEFIFGSACPSGDKMILDLGEAYEIAEVWLNGTHAGTRICPPYRFEVTGLIRDGVNSLRIDVTNTLAKKLGKNYFDKAMPQEPSGLLGPVRLLR